MSVTALYTRLSHDDESPGESVSIRNQKEFLEKYAVEHDFLPFCHFSDDGFTGMNFQRPGFQQMLQEIEKGNVRTVIVRDLSRFGRNYREAGFYLEKVFPSCDVRFIAVINQVDTKENEEDFSVPLMNVINDWYSRDLSRRIRATFQQMAKAGKRVNGIAVYGYVADRTNRHRWIPDPVTAEVVRKIVRWSLEGHLHPGIAERLNTEGVLRPNDYYLVRGWIPRHIWRNQQSHRWNKTSIRDILRNEEYSGTKILQKKRDPIRFPKDHEAVISPENWMLLQRRLDHYETRQHPGVDHAPFFPALFHCARCGRRLQRGLRRDFRILGCRKAQYHQPSPSMDLDLAEEVLRMVEETLVRSIPDRKALCRKLCRIQKENLLRHEKTAKEYLNCLEDRLHIIAECMMELYEDTALDPDILPRLLRAYAEERELIQREMERFEHEPEPMTIDEDTIRQVFLRSVYAFVDRITVTAKSTASRSQYVLVYLNVKIPQPPPRELKRYLYTYKVHFIPAEKTTVEQRLQRLLKDELIL